MTTSWWWLSFASSERNLGVALVSAPDFGTAVLKSHALRCNPGGEVNGWEVPASLGLGDPAPKWQHRLLNTDEISEMSLEWTGHPVVSTLDEEPIDPCVVDETRNEVN